MKRPRGFARFVGGQGFHCLYLVTAEDGALIKIGIAADVMDRLSTLRSANAVELRLHRHWWLAGRPISERIKKSFCEMFEPQRIRGDWFGVSLSEAEALIERTISQIGTWSATEAEMITEMQRREHQRIGRIFSHSQVCDGQHGTASARAA